VPETSYSNDRILPIAVCTVVGSLKPEKIQRSPDRLCSNFREELVVKVAGGFFAPCVTLLCSHRRPSISPAIQISIQEGASAQNVYPIRSSKLNLTTRTDSPASRWLLILLLLIAGYFFHEFLVPVLGALIIGFASWPIYRRLHEAVSGRDGLAASIAVLTVMVVLIVPLSMAFTFAFDEVKSWVEWLIEANRDGAPMPDWLRTLPLVGEYLTPYWLEHVDRPQALSELAVLFSGEQLGNIYRWLLALSTQAFHLLLILVFMLITLFFVFKDGYVIAAQLDRVGSSVLGERWGRFSRMVPATVSSTVTGMGLVALGEGVVLGTAYWIAGVPSPVALGVLTGFMALIPGGAPLAFTLVSIYLAATGDIIEGVALFLWGSVELFVVDKTIRPTLVGGPIKLPFLPTFFGLIGGVTTMGIVGLFIGPVLMALLVAIWREWLYSLSGPTTNPEQEGS